jgi:nitrite reductase/ring-hydroxylating ferredoxin subunit
MSENPLAMAEEIPAGEMRGFRDGEDQILVANVGGSFFAINNVCTHNGCRISGGILRGDVVQCPCHGSQFNVRTGEVVHGPAKKSEPVRKISVKNGGLFLDR